MAEDNVRSIVCLFSCFCGFKINLHKSKLVGINVNFMEVEHIALIIRYVTLKLPFMYLGLIAGSNLARIQWERGY